MVVADADRVVYHQRAPRRRLLSAPGPDQERNERASAAIEGGDLSPFYFDVQVVDAEARRCGQEVFHRLNARAVPPDGRGVVGIAHALRGGGDALGMPVFAEDDPRVRRRRRHRHASGLAGM